MATVGVGVDETCVGVELDIQLDRPNAVRIKKQIRRPFLFHMLIIKFLLVINKVCYYYYGLRFLP